MRPDSHAAMRATIEFGPSHLDPKLFAGELSAILAGLRTHANTISHARHVAMEETYPRTRALLGDEVFHAIASEHLERAETLRQPHTQIGKDFALLLNGTAHDLALVEWAFLEAHGAADCEPFDLEAIVGLDAETVAATPVMLHPATRIVPLTTSESIKWNGKSLGGAAIFVTRPRSEVLVTGVDRATIEMAAAFNAMTVGELLDQDSVIATVLIKAGALAINREFLL